MRDIEDISLKNNSWNVVNLVTSDKAISPKGNSNGCHFLSLNQTFSLSKKDINNIKQQIKNYEKKGENEEEGQIRLPLRLGNHRVQNGHYPRWEIFYQNLPYRI